ncbi:hypothetical protein DL546_006738 [Coniochaeta pulveracea]|uniref:Uncharacterized protein n=1 Tax=Coniochaeta pulveracea TaxID=177199 RepID=A0A420YAZ2_9PEZI|nr:hypothetical protein DL546_006738 [Coniochaeta pulveracea]
MSLESKVSRSSRGRSSRRNFLAFEVTSSSLTRRRPVYAVNVVATWTKSQQLHASPTRSSSRLHYFTRATPRQARPGAFFTKVNFRPAKSRLGKCCSLKRLPVSAHVRVASSSAQRTTHSVRRAQSGRPWGLARIDNNEPECSPQFPSTPGRSKATTGWGYRRIVKKNLLFRRDTGQASGQGAVPFLEPPSREQFATATTA